MKNKKCLTAFLLIVLLINLTIRNFNLRDFEVQLHDTYIVFDAPTAVFAITLIVLAVVSMYVLVDIVTRRYKILALIVAIVNPISAIFILMLAHISLQTFTTFKASNPENDAIGHIIFVCLSVALFCIQVVIEWKALVHIRELLTGD